MEKFSQLFAFFLPLVMMVEVEAIRGSYKPQASNVKLFVFGDSYVDTGNTPKFFSNSWKQPYGVTYPGKPSGRFSDGRVLTDYIAQFFGIKSLVPYEERKSEVKLIQHGMNFAFGGTGVFDTLVPEPNMSKQISYLEQLIEQRVYTKNELDMSIALVSLAGNDYATYLQHHNGTVIQGLSEFMTKVINQLASDLKRIHDLGVRKIGVLGIEPLGCLPRFTAPSSFQHCNETLDLRAKSHNQLLKQAVQKLRNDNKGSAFVLLDLYSAFISALNRTGNPLRPCCVGLGNGNSCGSVDEKGEKKYSVCKNPNSSFFWDNVHPAQYGWAAVYSVLQSSLHQLY